MRQKDRIGKACRSQVGRGAVLGFVLVAISLALFIRPSDGEEGKEPPISVRAEKAMSEGIDLFVERIVAKGKSMDEGDWETVKFVVEMVERRARGIGSVALKAPEYSKLPIVIADKLTDKDLFPRPKRAVARNVEALATSDCLILSLGAVNVNPGAVADSVILSNGGVRIASSLAGSIVLCNGDLEIVDGGISRSIVVAKGGAKAGRIVESVLVSEEKCEIDGFVAKSHVISGGYMDISGHVDESTLRTRKVITAGEVKKGSVIQEKQQVLPHIAEFFEPRSLGIDVQLQQGRVMVRNASLGSSFSKAGLMAGDTILRVGSTGVDSVEDFRNLLRKECAGKRATLSIGRGARVLNVSVKFED